MPVCAQAVQQADGKLLLVLDPTATDLSTCPYVVQSGAEVANSLFAMSAEDGAYLSGAVVSCWAVAWSIKAIIHILKGSTE